MINFNLTKRILSVVAVGLISASASFAQYCTPTYTTGTAAGDFIDGVAVADISNTGTGGAITGTGYSDYTFLSTSMTAGTTYTMTVYNNPTWSQTYTAWIDYNQDEVFGADEVLGGVGLFAGASGTITFTVPAAPMPGSTRMRVRCIYPSGLAIPLDPCSSATYGEAEDYTVNFGPAAANDIGVMSIDAPVTAGGLGVEAVTVTIMNYGTNEAGDFNVEYSVDGGAVVSEVYPGTLAPGASASYTFAGTYDFSADGCYSITANTDWVLDEIPADDAETETVCNLCVAAGDVYYMLSNTTGGEPWFTTTNTTAMNTVFADAWDYAYYETADPASIFSAATSFVFMEGSDSHANELETFLNTNMAAIEAWVAAGGRLFLNAAPNEGDGMSFGFGGVNCTYAYYTNTATAVDATHPIFNGPYTPVVTTYTGSSFGHAIITGGDAVGIIDDAFAPGNYTCSELPYGAGLVVFGGMTTNNFHSPLTEAANLRANILSYASCGVSEVVICETPTELYVDGITDNDAVCHWNAIAGADQYRFVLQNTATGTIAKRKSLTNSYDLTDKLDPLTTYAFRVKTVCYDDLADISAPSPWVYWTTLGRVGDVNGAVSLFPNPNNGTFTVNVNGYEGNTFNLNVYSATGQLVYSKSIDVNAASYSELISIDNAAAGMYQVALTNAQYTINYSIVVTK